MAIDLQELATAIGQLVLRFRMRRRTAADWTSGNEVLLSAEWGLETDTRKKKIGDGVTAWTSLPYDDADSGIQSVVAGTNVTVDNTDPLNPIVSSTAGGGGGSSPWPDGCIMWFSTSHRNGVNGNRVHYLNAPADYQGRGLVATSNGAVYNSTGGVAGGATFSIFAADAFANCTIMAVIITPVTLGISTIMSGSSTSSLQFRLEDSSGNWHLTLVIAGVAVVGDDSAATSLAASTMYLVTATFAAGTWTLRRDTVQTASGTGAGLPTNPNDRIGTSSSGEIAQHDLMELVVFDRALGSTPMAAAEGLLMTQYGI